MTSVTLDDIAEIRAGHPFRGSIAEDNNGNGYVIQIRDQHENSQIGWDQLTKTAVTGRKKPQWLMPGDIIFTGRGGKNLASLISNEEINQLSLPVVCSPHYYQITIKDHIELLPEFLAWQLNHAAPIRKHFQKLAEGSAQISIARSGLNTTPIAIPNIKQQYKLLAYIQSVDREVAIYSRLIALRQQELSTITTELLTADQP